VLVLGVLALIC